MLCQGTAYLCVWSIVHGVIGGVCHRLKVDDTHFLGLPNPVSSGDSLLLILGVGVRVIHHHCVGCLQVQAPAGSPDAQQEDEDLTVGCIEALDGNLPAVHRVQPSAEKNELKHSVEKSTFKHDLLWHTGTFDHNEGSSALAYRHKSHFDKVQADQGKCDWEMGEGGGESKEDDDLSSRAVPPSMRA